jgi:hypothetical protein
MRRRKVPLVPLCLAAKGSRPRSGELSPLEQVRLVTRRRPQT